MPFYDRLCEACGWLAVDVLETVHADAPACPECGQPTVRAWLVKPPTPIQDSMDHWQVNGLKAPRHFTSKQERARWMKSEGFVEYVRHVGQDGTDRSPFTSRWATMDQQTLDNARILLERASQEPARNEPKYEPLNVTTTYGDVRVLPGGGLEFSNG